MVEKGSRELVGWKQIAAYLQVSIPTARSYYENSDLPVARRGRRYFAETADLDGWKRRFLRRDSGSKDSPAALGKPVSVVPARSLSPRYRTLIGIALLLAASIVLLGRFGIRDTAIRSLVIEGNRLEARGSEGQSLWRWSLPPGNVAREDRVVLADVDADGEMEALVSTGPTESHSRTGGLYCLDSEGRVLWSFPYGRRLENESRVFEPVFDTLGLDWIEVGGRSYILARARHFRYYPTQVLLFDPTTGALLSEYWHPGYLEAVALFDVDGDGREEVVLGGVNNPEEGPGRAVLAVLSLPWGESRPTTTANFYGPHNAVELAYLVFDRVPAWSAEENLVFAAHLEVRSAEQMIVGIGSRRGVFMFHTFGPGLELLRVDSGDTHRVRHNELFHQGALAERYDWQKIRQRTHVVRLETAPDGNAGWLAARFEGGASASPRQEFANESKNRKAGPNRVELPGS